MPAPGAPEPPSSPAHSPATACTIAWCLISWIAWPVASAHAETQEALWARLVIPPLSDWSDLLAASESYQLSAGLTPGAGLDLRRADGADHAVLNLFGSGAYHLHQEYNDHGVELLASGSLSLGALHDKATGSAVDSRAVALSIPSLAGQFCQYLAELEVGGSVWPVFVAGSGGVEAGAWSYVEAAASVTKTYALPLSVAVAVGVGRVLPVAPRMTLWRLEQMLLAAGLLEAPLPEVVRTDIIRLWVELKNEIGVENRLLLALKLMSDATVLKRTVTPSISYKAERIISELPGLGATDRLTGWDARVALRLGYVVTNTHQDPTVAVELRARKVLNLSVDAEIRLDPGLGVAPRNVDRAANTLPGMRRVAPQLVTPLATQAIFPSGTIVFDVPVTYQQVLYDAYYNRSGLLELHTGVAAGHTPGVDPGAALALGGTYTFFTSGTSGLRAGLNFALGYAGGKFLQSAQLVASIVEGTGTSYYVAPDPVGDTVPFDTAWIPAP